MPDLHKVDAKVTELLTKWKENLAGGPQSGRSDSTERGRREWVDNNISVNALISELNILGSHV